MDLENNGNSLPWGLLLAFGVGISVSGWSAEKVADANPVQFSGSAAEALLPEDENSLGLEERFDFLDSKRSVGGVTHPLTSEGFHQRGFPAGNVSRRPTDASTRWEEMARNWGQSGTAGSQSDNQFEAAVDRWSKGGSAGSARAGDTGDWLKEVSSSSSSVGNNRGAPSRRDPADSPALVFEQPIGSSRSLDPVVDLTGLPGNIAARSPAGRSSPYDGPSASGIGLPDLYRGAPASASVSRGSVSDLFRVSTSVRDLIEGPGAAARREAEDSHWLSLQSDATRDELNPVTARRWDFDPLSVRPRRDPWDRQAVLSTAEAGRGGGNASPLRELTERVLGPSSLAPALPASPSLDAPRPQVRSGSVELPGRKF